MSVSYCILFSTPVTLCQIMQKEIIMSLSCYLISCLISFVFRTALTETQLPKHWFPRGHLLGIRRSEHETDQLPSEVTIRKIIQRTTLTPNPIWLHGAHKTQSIYLCFFFRKAVHWISGYICYICYICVFYHFAFQVFALFRAMKSYLGRRAIYPLILNLDTRWKWVVSFTLRPLCPAKERRYELNRRPCGIQGRFGLLTK
jgi:hypothetical protein